jgi:hypothetical protein
MASTDGSDAWVEVTQQATNAKARSIL